MHAILQLNRDRWNALLRSGAPEAGKFKPFVFNGFGPILGQGLMASVVLSAKCTLSGAVYKASHAPLFFPFFFGGV